LISRLTGDPIRILGVTYVISLIAFEWLVADELRADWGGATLLEWAFGCGAFAPVAAVGPLLPLLAALALTGNWPEQRDSTT
jgi:hypothetical protein